MTIPRYYFLPSLPEALAGLAELALDMRWSWNHTADRMWEYIDPELWKITSNPWLILQIISPQRLEALANDAVFLELLDQLTTEYHESLDKAAWFKQTYPGSSLKVAFFCMEFGLSEVLPIYSGGLGILAGDYLKTARDLGVPVVGVGLLYQRGYFRQVLDSRGGQMEYYPYNEPRQLPVVPVRKPDGQWLRLTIDFPGRPLWIRAWEVKIGQVRLYLLDTNDPVNNPADRGITSELYGGGPEMRLQQEMVLGIGGWRVLSTLNQEPNICHLNEGHAALAAIERARSFMRASGQPFEVALAATRAGNIFTTHTPVEAGFDRFSTDLVERYLGRYMNETGIRIEEFLEMGRKSLEDKKEPFNMAYLAVRVSGTVNAVSRLHREVSQSIFQPLFPRWPQREVPLTHVTNGAHMPTWDSAEADRLWTESGGKDRWLGSLETLMIDFKKLPDEVLWQFRQEKTRQLVSFIRQRLALQLTEMGALEQEIHQYDQLLDPDILTIGFARRFTEYKRPNLMLYDPDRLIRILNHPQRPVQIIIAGKAHPLDYEGKALVQAWTEFIRQYHIQHRVVFIADYDMALAGQLVQGVDVWVNTPRRPWEACGTSGMKVLVNGGLNISERDGWWAEAYRPEVGWAIGDGRVHNNDPDWDKVEAEQLLTILEKEIVPIFYDRDNKGIPHTWIEKMRASMSELTPEFSTNRMLREYIEKLYLPALDRYQSRTAENYRIALQINLWQKSIRSNWSQLRFGKLEIETQPGYYDFHVPVYLSGLDPEDISVQLYADPVNTTQPEIHRMIRGERLFGTSNGYNFTARIPDSRPAFHYTPRIVPFNKDVSVPLEENHILWYEP